MTDLITLAEYKDAKEIKSPNLDVKIETLITLVSDFVEVYCGRRFLTETYTDALYGVCEDSIYIQNPPLTDVAVIEFYNTSREWELVDLEAYLIEEDIITFLDLPIVHDTPKKPFRLEYTGGYVDIPAALRLAVIDMVTFYHKNEATPKKSVSSLNVQAPGFTDNNLPSHIKRVLDLYRVIDNV